MRIFVLSYGFPTEEYPTNGIFQWDQARALAAYGHEVVFAAIDLRSFRKKRAYGIRRFQKNGVEVLICSAPIGPVRPILKSVGKYFFSRLFKKTEKEIFTPDIVHAHFGESAIYASEFCRRHKIPLVITEHSSELHSASIKESRRRELRSVYESADALISVSTSLQRSIEAHTGVLSVYVPNIIDTDTFYPSKKDRAGAAFVSVCNLKKSKGTDALLRAFASLKKELPFATLTVIGDGPERASLTELARELGIENDVTFEGELSRQEIANAFADCDVFVLASRGETFGVAYAEALAAGLPTVGTRCGGPEDFLTEECGVLVDIDDTDALSRAMADTVRRQDLYDAHDIAEYARSRFSGKRVAKKLTEIFETVVSEVKTRTKRKKSPQCAPHSYLYRFLVLALLISSGFGDTVNIFGIKLSYIAAFSVLVYLIVDRVREFRVTKNKYYLGITLFAIAWMVYAVLQVVFVKDTSLWVSYLRALAVNVFLLCVMLDYVREIGDIKFLLYCFAAYIAVCLCVGYVEIATDFHLLPVRENSHYLPHSFYGNENDNAAVLFYGVLAYLLCMSLKTPKILKLISLFALPSAVFQIIATNSRAASYGLILLCVLISVYSVLCVIRRKSGRAYFITLAVMCAFAVGAVTYVVNVYTVSELISFISSEGNAESDTLRYELIVSGVRALKENFGMGLGAGQSILLNGINLHNFYLEIFCDYGIIIGTVFAVLMIHVSFGNSKRRYNILTNALICSFPAAMLLVGVGPSSALKLRATFIILGIIFSLKYQTPDRAEISRAYA